jgi:hypothetical protein
MACPQAGVSRSAKITIKNGAQNRGGPTISGVEGLPGTAGPLDPEAGLGGIVSLGLF